jgi:hypothetical protein
MRKADRDRAAVRRDRQHGETEEQYRERIRVRLQETTGLVVDIYADHAGKERRHLLRGYLTIEQQSRHGAPLIRVVRKTLSAAAGEFEDAAGKMRSAGLIK